MSWRVFWRDVVCVLVMITLFDWYSVAVICVWLMFAIGLRINGCFLRYLIWGFIWLAIAFCMFEFGLCSLCLGCFVVFYVLITLSCSCLLVWFGLVLAYGWSFCVCLFMNVCSELCGCLICICLLFLWFISVFCLTGFIACAFTFCVSVWVNRRYLFGLLYLMWTAWV